MSHLHGGLAGSSQSLGSGIGVGGLGNRVLVSEVVPMLIPDLRPRFTDMTGRLIYSVVLTGSITPSGDVLKTTTKLLSGGITPSGAVLKTTKKLLSGAVTFVGTALKSMTRILSGVVAPIGTVVPTWQAAGGSTAPGKVTVIGETAESTKVS